MTDRSFEPITAGSSAEPPVPATIADYQVQRTLGYGNNGGVYLARPPDRLPLAEEFVAVKVFNGPCHDAAYDRAVEDLRAVSALASPYVARVFEAGLDGPSFFYAMDYVALGSLAAPGRPLSQIEVLLALSHTASAVQTMNQAGIAHAAIKPQNVLIGAHSALLADLGLGRYLRPGLTMTGVATASSVEYLDPALLRGASPSRSTEVWSLGATLHRALTGVGLYGELSDTEPLRAIRRVMSATPAIAPQLPTETATLIQACLAAPELRIPSAGALAQHLLDLTRTGDGPLSAG
ncbi:MAG: serine/threonine protein kinase [Geodermatophilaceae bacterium]|nr:serine/threonine protein kinase [Geodermatophilaceae bacterium]